MKRNYKDSIFRFVFSNLKDYFLDLYNAVSGMNYSSDAKIKNVTIDNVFVSGIKNDIAYSVEDKLVVLFEHQSTINENMPFRMFLYLANIYDRMIPKEEAYRKKRIMIPAPELYVLYNGSRPLQNTELKLSDSYISQGARIFADVSVDVRN